MNSYFGTTVARRRLPHFRHSSASEPAANQPSTSRSEEQEISTTTGWVLLKQPDNQKPTRPVFSKQTDCSRSETSSMNRSTWVLPQRPRGGNISGGCHSKESLPLGLPACDVPMAVHPRISPLVSGGNFHYWISRRPPHRPPSAGVQHHQNRWPLS